MNPEQEKQLKETYKLAKENNDMLRKIRRSMFWSKLFKIIYIVIIVGVAIGGFYFIQPYLEDAIGTYRKLLNSSVEKSDPDSSFPTFGEIFQSF